MKNEFRSALSSLKKDQDVKKEKLKIVIKNQSSLLLLYVQAIKSFVHLGKTYIKHSYL